MKAEYTADCEECNQHPSPAPHLTPPSPPPPFTKACQWHSVHDKGHTGASSPPKSPAVTPRLHIYLKPGNVELWASYMGTCMCKSQHAPVTLADTLGLSSLHSNEGNYTELLYVTVSAIHNNKLPILAMWCPLFKQLLLYVFIVNMVLFSQPDKKSGLYNKMWGHVSRSKWLKWTNHDVISFRDGFWSNTSYDTTLTWHLKAHTHTDTHPQPHTKHTQESRADFDTYSYQQSFCGGGSLFVLWQA